MRTHIFLTATILFGWGAALAQSPESVLQDNQRSHIEGNVPAAQDFDTFLRRDIAAYFQNVRGITNANIEIELLRKGPTQSGVALPKYYAWVVVKTEKKEAVAGALRLAAIDRVRFEVTDFLSRSDIKSSPGGVAAVFPAPLVAGILERASR